VVSPDYLKNLGHFSSITGRLRNPMRREMDKNKTVPL